MTTVRFSDLHGQLQAEATFNNAAQIKDVVAEGVTRLGFPTHYDSGEPIKYRARDANTGSLVGPEQEVTDLQGPEPRVELIGEIPAA
jgi:hypothetical protein